MSGPLKPRALQALAVIQAKHILGGD